MDHIFWTYGVGLETLWPLVYSQVVSMKINAEISILSFLALVSVYALFASSFWQCPICQIINISSYKNWVLWQAISLMYCISFNSCETTNTEFIVNYSNRTLFLFLKPNFTLATFKLPLQFWWTWVKPSLISAPAMYFPVLEMFFLLISWLCTLQHKIILIK